MKHAINTMQDEASTFLTLCRAITDIASRPGSPVSVSTTKTRSGLEALAIELADLVAPDVELIEKVLQAPSLPMMQAIFDGKNGDQWRSLIKERNDTCWEPKGQTHYLDFLPTPLSSCDLIIYHHSLGLPDSILKRKLPMRILSEDDPSLDSLLHRYYNYPENEDAFTLKLSSVFPFPVDLMRPGFGSRHVLRWQQMMAQGHKPMHDRVQYLIENAARSRFWRDLCVFAHIGADLSAVAEFLAPEGLEVISMFSSSHGKFEVFAMEPSLIDMLARNRDGIFYGLTRDTAMLPPRS